MFQKQILREDHYLLEFFEKKYVKPIASVVPSWIETYHLTWMSILWSVGVIISSYLARYSIRWLWVVSAIILLQYFTDILDGEVGRRRNTGLIRWGFYMDHFLDFIFLSSLFYGYYLVLKDVQDFIIITYIIITAFMFHCILTFPITQKFNISYFGIGVSEIRIVALIINSLLIFNIESILSYGLLIPIVLFVALCHTMYTTQKDIWKIDTSLRKKHTSYDKKS